MDNQILERFGLLHLTRTIQRFEKPAIGFSLVEPELAAKRRSRLGGRPLVPPEFNWPTDRGRKLDFLLQVDLSDVAHLDLSSCLPDTGLLTFFYDLENQPWGYDPKNLSFFKVALFEGGTELSEASLPDIDYEIPMHSLDFAPVVTLPYFGSADYEKFEKEAQLNDQESDSYFDLVEELERRTYSGKPRHRLLGHSSNIQNDMQLEAELVMNGLYCGNSTGYNDPRAKFLAQTADEWTLLLQLDTDDSAGLMWGDGGMLYYWIRRSDLSARNLDHVWMTMQCF